MTGFVLQGHIWVNSLNVRGIFPKKNQLNPYEPACFQILAGLEKNSMYIFMCKNLNVVFFFR